MSNLIHVASLFRQNFTPEPVLNADGHRHWLMDSRAGRDILLLAANMRRIGEGKGPLIKFGADLDPYLEPMIDRLDLRAMSEPRTAWQLISVDFQLTLLSFKIVVIGY